MGPLSRRLVSYFHRLVDPTVAAAERRIADDVNATVSDRITELSDELQRRLRDEMVEVARMLRMQGDADDELAETLGRTLTRLSAEVETLSAAVAELEARGGWATPAEAP